MVTKKNKYNEVSRVVPSSVGIILALFGVISGLLFAIQAIIISSNSPLTFGDANSLIAEDPSLTFMAYAIALKWVSLVVFPLVFAIMYYVSGWIFAAIYNFIAKKFGGIKIELD